MHRIAERLTQRSVKEMRRRVVALRILAPLRWDACMHAAPVEFAGELAERRRSAFDLSDAVDVDAPALANDLPFVRHLSARFRIERRFAQEHGDAIPAESAQRHDVGVEIDRVVADEVRIRIVRLLAALPLRQLAERIRLDAQLARLALVLGARALL